MIDLRAGLAAVSICLLIALIDFQPRPVKAVETKYCVIDYRAVVKRLEMLPSGEVVPKQSVEWVKGYGPCSLQDSYRYI